MEEKLEKTDFYMSYTQLFSQAGFIELLAFLHADLDTGRQIHELCVGS